MTFDPAADPFTQLDALVKEAADQKIKDPNAMALATLGENEMPSVRIVLYKGLVRGGLSFFTNYEGRKGHELAEHSKASVCFFWNSLERQVRVEGVVARLSAAESDAYFASRGRLSQLGAWASHQSEEIASLDEVQARLDALDQRYAGVSVPRPLHWGGYHLVPSSFEFWFGRGGRLHERYCYERQGSSGWRRFMRSP